MITISISQKHSQNQLLQAALCYLRFGYSVIPLKPKDKRPLINWAKYQKKKPTELEVQKWWSRWPSANVGIITGEVSGIIALDVDGPEGEKTLAQGDYIKPPTVISRTGGGGWHYLYKHPGFSCENFSGKKGETILPKVDFRGDGGYIVAPPSIHESGNKYEWAISPEIEKPGDPPFWLVELIKAQGGGKKITSQEWQNNLYKGERDSELTRRAGSLLVRGNIPPEEVATMLKAWNEAHCIPPLDDRGVEKIVKSVAQKEGRKDKKEENKSPYFKGSKFIPKLLGDEILRRYHFKYTADELFYYKGGVYKPGGKELIDWEAQRLLGDDVRDNRIREAYGYIKRASYAELPTPDKTKINLLNGIYDIENEGLLEHSPDKFDLVQLPVEYKPGAECPEFDKYLETTLDPDVIPLVDEIMGYCLVPDTRFEKAVMLTGSGSNGKSVLLDTIQALIGKENTSNVELQELEENRFKCAELLGKLINVFSDLDDRALRSSTMFKVLVTGDRVTAERKFGQPFEFNSFSRMLFSANSLPGSRDRTFAYYRRWLIIPFNKTFDGESADKDLRGKLKQELPGIFNRALRGLKRLIARGYFTEPAEVREALEEYKKQNDSLAAFVAERVTFKKDGLISKQEFYNIYRRWCEDQGLKPFSQKKVKESLYRTFPEVDEVREGNYGPWCWVGVRVDGYDEFTEIL